MPSWSPADYAAWNASHPWRDGGGWKTGSAGQEAASEAQPAKAPEEVPEAPAPSSPEQAATAEASIPSESAQEASPAEPPGKAAQPAPLSGEPVDSERTLEAPITEEPLEATACQPAEVEAEVIPLGGEMHSTLEEATGTEEDEGQPIEGGQAGKEAFATWLLEVEPRGSLSVYKQALEESYDTVEQVERLYCLEQGVLDATFFDDVGIDDAEHRQLFSDWFTRCSPPCVPPSPVGSGSAAQPVAAATACEAVDLLPATHSDSSSGRCCGPLTCAIM